MIKGRVARLPLGRRCRPIHEADADHTTIALTQETSTISTCHSCPEGAQMNEQQRHFYLRWLNRRTATLPPEGFPAWRPFYDAAAKLDIPRRFVQNKGLASYRQRTQKRRDAYREQQGSE